MCFSGSRAPRRWVRLFPRFRSPSAPVNNRGFVRRAFFGRTRSSGSGTTWYHACPSSTSSRTASFASFSDSATSAFCASDRRSARDLASDRHSMDAAAAPFVRSPSREHGVVAMTRARQVVLLPQRLRQRQPRAVQTGVELGGSLQQILRGPRRSRARSRRRILHLRETDSGRIGDAQSVVAFGTRALRVAHDPHRLQKATAEVQHARALGGGRVRVAPARLARGASRPRERDPSTRASRHPPRREAAPCRSRTRTRALRD